MGGVEENYSKRINFCSINLPWPLFPKEGIKESPPLKKGDYGGFKMNCTWFNHDEFVKTQDCHKMHRKHKNNALKTKVFSEPFVTYVAKKDFLRDHQSCNNNKCVCINQDFERSCASA
jgi:hypothetical protein